MESKTDKIRIDKYLWCIRIFKTRNLAAEACDKGRVKLNDTSIKASKAVQVGDQYEIKTESRKWIIKVNSIISNRVAYIEAIKHYTDLTPIEEKEAQDFLAPSFHTGKRLSKTGRPSKKQRRNLEDFLD
ncbi:MAG: RNA-binding S4 domain-containing protein [Chitinophagaceae bacterium]|nr:RNA-binding S4 domain-containing protein [Chitinophagaceae bacterium]